MLDGRSEDRVPTVETNQTGAEVSLSETNRLVSSPRARPRSRRGLAAVVFKGLANAVFLSLVIYLTYFFTMFFSKKPPTAALIPESARVAAKKIEELRAEERQLLTTYGPVNPVTRSVRIPIDRAMALVAAEGGQPAVIPAVSPPSPPTNSTLKVGAVSEAPKVGAITLSTKGQTTTAVQIPATASPPVPAPAPPRVGMAPDQLYRAVCIACHDVDGKGKLVRVAMPLIPDLTDPKWQATRTDAELQHSIMEGKGLLMLPMKDKLALAHTDVKEMVAFMRSFQKGNPLVAAGSPAAAPATLTTQPLVQSSPSAPAASPVLTTAPALAPPASSVLPATAPASTSLVVSPLPSTFSPTAPAPTNLVASPLPSVSPLPLAPTASLPRNPATAVTSPEKAAKLRVAGEFYNINCVVCHGPDGRGTAAVRVAMPALPDFTNREWNISRENPQLVISVLDGKGTLMPPWRARIAPSLAQDLVAFIRTYGPADLVAANAPPSELGTRLRQLRQQWQELDQQAQTLARP